MKWTHRIGEMSESSDVQQLLVNELNVFLWSLTRAAHEQTPQTNKQSLGKRKGKH